MNQRLLQFIQAENMTQAQLADTLKVARASVSNILSGRNKPGYDFLESLMLHFPELNLEWLVTGRGRMYKSGSNHSEPSTSPASQPVSETLFPVDNPAENPVFDDTPVIRTEIPASQGGSEARRNVTKIILFFDDGTFQEIIS